MVLMLIPFHTTVMFDPGGEFYLKNIERSPLLGHLTNRSRSKLHRVDGEGEEESRGAHHLGQKIIISSRPHPPVNFAILRP